MDGLQIVNTVDNSQLIREMQRARNAIINSADTAVKEGKRIDDTFERLKKSAIKLTAGFEAGRFIQQVVDIRGEFQKLDSSLTTLLGSASKANALMRQLTETAATTPFGLNEVADGAKQLLAYNIAAEDVNDTLVHLGDIAAGLKIPLGDLVYLYGTTIMQGRMYTQDLRQFMGRGIPLAEELAKQFGVTKDKVGDLVKTGKVGAEEFKKAIMDMSSEGGKFGGMMEQQSKTIGGKISNLTDDFEMMFNEIGTKSEGIINGTLDVAADLVDNYERVGKTVASLVMVYGTYRTAMMTAIALQNLQAAGISALTTKEAIHYGWLVLVEKAQRLLNSAMLTNPFVLAATAIAGVTAALIMMKTHEERVTEAKEKYNEKLDESKRKEEELRSSINNLLQVAGDEELSIDARRKALVKLIQKYPDIFAKYKTEAEMLANIRDIHKEINELNGKNSISNPEVELKSVNSQIARLVEELESRAGKRERVDDTYVGEHTQNIKDKLDALYNRRMELYDEIQQNKNDSYLENLTGISNDDLQAEIQRRKDLLAEMQINTEEFKDKEGELFGYINSGGAKGKFSKTEIEGQLQLFEAEQNRRNEKRMTPAEQKAQLLKTYKEAEAALAAFDNSTTKYTAAEAEQERKRLQDAVDAAKKAYQQFGGEAIAKEQEKDNKDAKEDMLAEQREAEEKRDKAFAVDQAAIDAMKEGSEKELKQMQLNHQMKMAQIDKEQQDLLNAKRERKAKDDPTYYSSGKYKEETLTYDELAGISSKRDSATIEYKNNILEYFNGLTDGASTAAEKMDKLKSSFSLINDELYSQMYQARETAVTPKDFAWVETLKGIRSEVTAAYLKSEKAIYDELLNDYKDFATRRKDLEEQYNKDVAIIKSRTPANEAEKARQQAALKERERAYKESLKSLNNEEYQTMQQSQQLLVDLFSDTADMSNKKIRETIENTKLLLDYIKAAKDENGNAEIKNDKGETVQTITMQQMLDLGFTEQSIQVLSDSPEQIKAIQEALKRLQDVSGKKNPFKQFSDGIKKLRDAKKEADSTNESLQDIYQSTSAIADMFGNVFGQISDIFETIGNQNMADIFGGLEDAMSSVSNIANGFAQGGIVGGIAAVAGEALNYVNKALEAEEAHQEALLAIQSEKNSQQHAYNMLLMQQNLEYEKAVTIFGSMDYNKAINAIQVARDAEKELSRAIASNGKRNNLVGSRVGVGTVMDRIRGFSTEGLRDIEVKTGHEKTGIFGWGKGKDVYSSVLDVYPELIDANGEFNKSLAETIISTRTMSDEDKAALQGMVDYAEMAEEAWAQVHDYLTSIFGDLGATITDCLVESFKKGESAAESMCKAVSSMLEQLAEDMMMATAFQDMFDKAQKDMEAVMGDESLTEEQRTAKYAEIIGGLAEDAAAKEEEAYKWLQMWKDEAAKHGLNLFDEGEYQQSASGKGFQAMDQDLGEELSGRFTSMNTGIYEIRDLEAQSNEILKRMEQGQGSIGIQMDAIVTAFATSNIHLAAIAKYSKAMDEKLQILNTMHDILSQRL